MKRIVLSLCTVAAMNSLVFAGGNMKDVEPAVEPVVTVPVVAEERPFYVGLGVTAVSARDASVSMDFFEQPIQRSIGLPPPRALRLWR